MTLNPYASPETAGTANADEFMPPGDADNRVRRFVGGYFGTVVAGSVFGLIGGVNGVGIGLVASGVVGLLCFGTAAFTTKRISPFVLSGPIGSLDWLRLSCVAFRRAGTNRNAI